LSTLRVRISRAAATGIASRWRWCRLRNQAPLTIEGVRTPMEIPDELLDALQPVVKVLRTGTVTRGTM
jgi:hypothetical protein